jgi:hypothetical protein
MGERLRGNVNDAADAAVGDRTADAGHMHTAGVTKGEENTATDRLGRAEQAEGMNRMSAPTTGCASRISSRAVTLTLFLPLSDDGGDHGQHVLKALYRVEDELQLCTLLHG